jgi:hypothetical protein
MGLNGERLIKKYRDFVGEARNIIFGLSTDGFNPFGEFRVVIALGL